MANKKSLSLKVANHAMSVDGPYTPMEQTLQTPIDPPGRQLYFPSQSLGSQNLLILLQQLAIYMNPHYSESDDILTDADEPQPRVKCSYAINFTPEFDALVLGVYQEILALPTTTPFSGTTPPLGLVSKVANETFSRLGKLTAPDAEAANVAFDTNAVITHEHLRNHAFQPVIMQLIRKRLIDLCVQARGASLPSAVSAGASATTSVQLSLPANIAWGLQPGSNGSTSSGNNTNNNNGLFYSGNPQFLLLILNLLLSEQNVAAFAQARLRSSLLSLRKHSLTRNNSYTGSNWLHVGNMAPSRPNGSLGMNPDLGASTDLLQLMHDFVPQAFINRPSGAASSSQASGGRPPQGIWGPPAGFNSMMGEYHTPPSLNKASFSAGETPPQSMGGGMLNTPGSTISDLDDFGMLLVRSRSSSRGTAGAGFPSPFPRPLTINTDVGGYLGAAQFGNGAQEALHSPFVSATIPSEDPSDYINSGSARANSGFFPESPKDVPMASSNNKINLPGQFSLSEKKRDSLKLKRGIH